MAEIFTWVMQIVFWWFTISLVLAWIKSRADQEETVRFERAVEILNNLVHRVKVEEHQGIFYWWDEDSDTFLAQGRTIEEVIDNLKKRFPEHHFFVKDNEDVTYRLKGPEWAMEVYKIAK